MGRIFCTLRPTFLLLLALALEAVGDARGSAAGSAAAAHPPRRPVHRSPTCRTRPCRPPRAPPPTVQVVDRLHASLDGGRPVHGAGRRSRRRCGCACPPGRGARERPPRRSAPASRLVLPALHPLRLCSKKPWRTWASTPWWVSPKAKAFSFNRSTTFPLAGPVTGDHIPEEGQLLQLPHSSLAWSGPRGRGPAARPDTGFLEGRSDAEVGLLRTGISPVRSRTRAESLSVFRSRVSPSSSTTNNEPCLGRGPSLRCTFSTTSSESSRWPSVLRSPAASRPRCGPARRSRCVHGCRPPSPVPR